MRGATFVDTAPTFEIIFQSTLPLRGATGFSTVTLTAGDDFNPRSPCGERQFWLQIPSVIPYFNPRSPCGERQDGIRKRVRSDDFNPRSPCGERRPALSPGRDLPYFNPRSPCGERRNLPPYMDERFLISIHAPLAGSDTGRPYLAMLAPISIHAPLAGSDPIPSTVRVSR